MLCRPGKGRRKPRDQIAIEMSQGRGNRPRRSLLMSLAAVLPAFLPSPPPSIPDHFFILIYSVDYFLIPGHLKTRVMKQLMFLFDWQKRTAAWRSLRTRLPSAESSSRRRIACATRSTCSTARHRPRRAPTERTAPMSPPSIWWTPPSAGSCLTSK